MTVISAVIIIIISASVQVTCAFMSRCVAVVNIDMSCQYKGKRNMYPFGFRVHAHTLGG